MVFVLAPASATAAPAPATSNLSHTWAYGAIDVLSKVGPNAAGNGWIFEGNATLGYTVNITEISTSSTTFELIVYRTMGLAYTIRFCDVTCASPTQWANETVRAYETTVTFANFTTQGTVFQNGTTGVFAIALEDTTTFLHANVTESTDVYLPQSGERGPHLGFLGANLVAKSAVAFTPALGLIPDQPILGTTWNSTSEFAATGNASWSYYYSLLRPVLPPPPVINSGEVSLSASGTVSVQGSYLNGSTSLGGTPYPVIVLIIVGPFDVREGFIFVPAPADIFGSAAQPWAGNATVSTSAQAATLDLKLSKNAAPEIIASSWKYSTAAANAATSSAIATGPAGVSPAVTDANPVVASGTVQGVPESSAQSQSAQNCLIKGSDCTTLSSPRSLLGLIVVGGVVVTVAVLVAVAVVSRRRRTPPPVYPNAVLYPPGAVYPVPPTGAPATPTSPPPPEDDPLDHLW